MNQIQQITTPIREASGKKLQAFTVFTTLIVAFIVFSSTLLLTGYSKLDLLDQYVCELPDIVQDREEEVINRSRLFEEDVRARGSLGARLYEADNEQLELPKLKRICSTISAESISLTDENGTVLHTTGPVTPPELFEARLPELEMRVPVLELYEASPDGAEEVHAEEAHAGTAIVMFPIQGDPAHRLVYEFSCEPMLEIYNTIGNWNDVLSRMFSGLDVYAFVRSGEDFPGSYSLDSFTKEEREQLSRETFDRFQDSRAFHGIGNKYSWRLLSFRNHLSLAVLSPFPALEADLLMVVPLWGLISTGVYCALTLSAFIVFSLILYSLYVLKVCSRKNGSEDMDSFLRRLPGKTRPGRNLLLASIACFSIMLLMLENDATIAYIGTTKRMALQNEVVWHENQTDTIRSSYTDIYRKRTQALAKLLTEHQEYRTHTSLEVLSEAIQAEYVMLFDKTGHEVLSSNSYTNFSVNGAHANLNEEYRAVLLGYPYAVVGPEEDPYTKQQQIGTAILLQDENEAPDGFLLAVFDAGVMNEELEKESLEHTVSSFAVTDGYSAAVIDAETGTFLAHTDEDKIGLSAKDYLTAETYTEDYAGFTTYDGKDMYISGTFSNGKSLLFMVPDRLGNTFNFAAFAMIAAVLLILGVLYCPKARELCARAMDEAIDNQTIEEDMQTDITPSLSVFTYGYAVFITLLAAVTLFAAYTMEWPAFTFVFGGLWSRGVHLFSLWAALFFLAVTLCVTILLRRALQSAEKRTDSRTRTILKLADSSAAYAAGACIVLGILYMFGVNTTALLASAGIVSIAVGMGAKDMAADIIAGVFIAIEDSIHMGDVVSIDSWKGRVTDMGIRTIQITDDKEHVKILNNSNITDLVNMSRKITDCSMELILEPRVSMAEIENILHKAVETASETFPELHGSLKLKEIHVVPKTRCTVVLTYSCAEVSRKSVARHLKEFLMEQIEEDMDRASNA